MILLPAETLGRKLKHTDSLCRKLVTEHNSLGRKQEIPTVSAEAKYDGQSLQEAKLAAWFIPCDKDKISKDSFSLVANH